MSRAHPSSLVALFAVACGPLVPFDDTVGDDRGGDDSSSADEGETGTRPGSSVADEGSAPGEVGEVGGDEVSDGGDEGDSGSYFVCGDGVVDPGEPCDDGNATPGDGCEPDCTVTPGLFLWEEIVDGAGDDDSARDVAVLANGDPVMVGWLSFGAGADAWAREYAIDGASYNDTLFDLGGDEVATSVTVTNDGLTFVAGVQPEIDSALLLRFDGFELVQLDGAPTDILSFTTLASTTAEGFVLVTNGGSFDELTTSVRRFDSSGFVLGDVAQQDGVFVGAAVPSADGGTIVAGGIFGGMGMGSTYWVGGLGYDASPLWGTSGAPEPGLSIRVRGLATAPDGRIVGVGTRGQGGPNDDDDQGWIWWWSAEGAPDGDGPLDIGGATARPNAVVVGNHGLVVGGSVVATEDGFVAGIAEDGTLAWGHEVVGDLGLEDTVSALAIRPGFGVFAVGTVTQSMTGEDAWIGMFAD